MAAPGQPQQRNAVLQRHELHVAVVRVQVWANAVERLQHALLQRDGVEVVHQQEARDHRVLREPRALIVVEHRVDPREPVVVHRQQLVEALGQLLDALLGVRLLGHQHIPVGVWTTLRTVPRPYICTPHGRHGSNEWTARMMSIPLNFSGPFSSKIGVFSTASS